MEQTALDMRPKCRRCGRAIHDDREIGEMAESVFQALKSRKHFIPDAAYCRLQDIAGEMWCRLRVCKPLSPAEIEKQAAADAFFDREYGEG